jgi:hypothetical protein
VRPYGAALLREDERTRTSRGEQGRSAVRAHRVPVELIGEVAALIAAYIIACGELVVSRADTISALCGPGQARRVAAYLARTHRARPNPAGLRMRLGRLLPNRLGMRRQT